LQLASSTIIVRTGCGPADRIYPRIVYIGREESRMPNVRIAKGLNLHYRKRGSGDRHLLLVHGNTASSLWWEKVMDLLPDGVTAWAPDLRGCGDSDKPEGGWTMADLGDDVFQFCQAVGIQRATVVGHSLGGAVAQQLTVDHPEPVERLVLVNSAEIGRA